MERYIALLRGINVGGKNKVPMPVLKTLFEENGFSEVVTYINSGNVIFTSTQTDIDILRKICEGFIKENFQFRVLVSIISVKDLIEAMEHAPNWWGEAEDSKHNGIFVIPPITAEEVFTQVGEAKPEYEKVDFYGQVIFWSAPIATFSKTRWSKVVGLSVYDSITIRNSNTVKKLCQLVKDMEAIQ